jgi:hypothetical protein
MDKLNIVLQGAQSHKIEFQGAQSHKIELSTSYAGTTDYEKLKNKPSINGVVLIGDKTSVDLNIVSENTESGWAGTPTYVPKKGEICLYTDTGKIKIGDGSVCLVDLPFIGEEAVDEVKELLRKHIEDQNIHVTQDEKNFWNAKLNYDVNGEMLVFNRN